MNLVLLEERDYIREDRIRLDGRRFRHIRDVHRALEGDELAVGLINGKIGTGIVVRLDEATLEMDVRLSDDPPAPLPVVVLLALPRPKVMRRVLYSLTVLGVKRIFLINSARVEKSYWQTPFLDREELRRQLLLGLEQARDTVLPDVQLRPRFKPFVEDELPGIVQGSLALVAHPSAGDRCPRDVRKDLTLAIGPEGGFVPFEIEAFHYAGMKAVSMGGRILNVETIVPCLIAKLFL